MKQKRLTIIFLSVIACLFACLAFVYTTASAEKVATNSLFYTSDVTLTNNTPITDGGKFGTLVSPTGNGAYLKVDRDMVGLTSLEFGIEDSTVMNDFVLSFNGTNNGFDMDFTKKGNNFFITVTESGVQLAEEKIVDTKDISLSFDANGREVKLNDVKICNVESIMPNYVVKYTFTGSGNLVLFSINGYDLSQSTLTNKSGPTIFADYSVNGVVSNFYTLSKPYGCDLLDGTVNNFDVEVKFGATQILGKSVYTENIGFVPVKSGDYTVTYFAQDSNSVFESQSYVLSVIGLNDFTPTEFAFDTLIENMKIGINSTMTIPTCFVSSESLSKSSYSSLLTVKKDGAVFGSYKDVTVEPSMKFTFSKTGEYEFIYKSSNKNLTGERKLVVNVVSNFPTINVPNFREYYFINDSVEFPKMEMSINGETATAQSVLNYPVSKKAVLTDRAKLSENGLYSVEYRANLGGKTYVFSRSLKVYQHAYETKEGSCVYTTSPLDENVSGVLVKMRMGDTLKVNDIVDLTDKKPSESVLKIDVIPTTIEITDFMQINVKFIDIYDESNYVTISCRRSRDDFDKRMSYVKAGYKEQPQVGIEGSSGAVYYAPSVWGEYISCSFCGVGQHTFDVSFDYEKRTIYANGKKIIELNNPLYFEELWEGFTTGECYVSISVQELMAMDATFMLTKVGDINLKNSFKDDTEAPVITIDTEYSLSELPSALVGSPYKIFDATAYDLISGSVKVIPTVYYAYSGSSKSVINIENGEFTPFMTGKYTIEYKAIDGNGNVGIKTVVVRAYDSLEEMSLSVLSAPEGLWLAGHEVSVAGYSVLNSNGNPSVKIIAKNRSSNNEYEVKNNKFIPYEDGEFDVIYVATDYIGRTATDSYAINVSTDGLAVFKNEADLPFVFISEVKYTVPELKAYTYVDGVEQEVPVKKYAKDSNGYNEITGEYVPMVAASGNLAEITYVATTGSGNVSKTYSVPVQIVKTGMSYDMTQYFLGDVSVTADESNVFITTSSDQTVKFIKPLIANGFEFDFNVNVEKNAFNNLDIYLTDIFDSNVRVKFSYIKVAGGKAYMSLNDGVAVSTVSTFNGSSDYSFVLTYNNDSIKLCDVLGNGLKINQTLYGKTFNGFPSGRVYFEFAFTGVESESQIKINSINGQKFNNSILDSVCPQMFVDGVLGGSFVKGSVYTISSAYALDVLDSTVQFTLSVESPNGEIVTDINGTPLNKVDPTVSRKIVLSESGYYKFSYSAKDTSNRLLTFGTVITVPDYTAPTLKINGEVSDSADVNSRVILPSATAYKNGELLTQFNIYTFEDEPVNVVVFVICPNTRREIASRQTNGKYNYTFKQKGKHTVVYVVYDEYGNSAERRFTVEVS